MAAASPPLKDLLCLGCSLTLNGSSRSVDRRVPEHGHLTLTLKSNQEASCRECEMVEETPQCPGMRQRFDETDRRYRRTDSTSDKDRRYELVVPSVGMRTLPALSRQD